MVVPEVVIGRLRMQKFGVLSAGVLTRLGKFLG